MRWYRSVRHGIGPDFRSPVPEGLTIPSGDGKFHHGMELISDLLVLGPEGLKQAIAILRENFLTWNGATISSVELDRILTL